LVLISPAAQPPPIQNSKEITGKGENLISKSCRSTLFYLRTEMLKQMEDDLHEDALNRR
jgi:hypothetical protein